MAKKSKVGALVLAAAFLAFGNIYAQEPIDYKQLMTKCGDAIKQVKSYNVEMEMNNSATINSQEIKNHFAKLHIDFVSPDRFKVEQILNEGSDENLWDGWIVIGNDYYEFRINPPALGQDLKSYHPVSSWAKGDNDDRKTTCKNNSPEGIIKQLEYIDTKYKRDSIESAAKDGAGYYVIKYSIGKESVNPEDLPPELRNAQIKGSCEVWINKDTYLPLKQTKEISFYSDEKNKASPSSNMIYTSSMIYTSYNNDKIKIDEPKLGSQVF